MSDQGLWEWLVHIHELDQRPRRATPPGAARAFPKVA